MAERFRLEEEAQTKAQNKASVCERKEMELVWKKRSQAERKRSEIPLLEDKASLGSTATPTRPWSGSRRPFCQLLHYLRSYMTVEDTCGWAPRSTGCASSGRPGPSTADFAARLPSTLSTAYTNITHTRMSEMMSTCNT